MKVKNKKFKKWIISFVNERELDEMLNELYEKKYYNWSSSKKKPLVFDVGALIGETVLYFKDLVPGARIVAFEPSPRSFMLLKKNVKQNNLKDVRLVNAAVSSANGTMNFYTSKSTDGPWGRGDSLKENKFNDKKKSKVVKVAAVRLSNYIREEIDLLKLDIEGAEAEVLQEIEPKLGFVKQIILEFHASVYNPENSFPKIMNILKKQGFTTKIFLSRWLLPNFMVTLVREVLSMLKVDEYWLRIYAKRQRP